MPGEFSDAGSIRALDAVTGRATQTLRTMYLALCTAAPADAQSTGTISMTEYAATGYSRQTVTFGTGAGGAGTPTTVGGVVTTANTAALSFGPFTAGTGTTITHAALVSASSGTTGDLVAYWTLDTSRTPATNDSISVAIGALTLAVD